MGHVHHYYVYWVMEFQARWSAVEFIVFCDWINVKQYQYGCFLGFLSQNYLKQISMSKKTEKMWAPLLYQLLKSALKSAFIFSDYLLIDIPKIEIWDFSQIFFGQIFPKATIVVRKRILNTNLFLCSKINIRCFEMKSFSDFKCCWFSKKIHSRMVWNINTKVFETPQPNWHYCVLIVA